MLYSYHKRKIPSSFSCTFFKRHRFQFESGNLKTAFSNVYYLVPSTINRREEINRHMTYVNLSPIDIPEKTFETKNNVLFDPSKLDIYCPFIKIMTEAVVEMLKKYLIYQIRIIKNADGLLIRELTNISVEWIGKNKERLPSNKYKMAC